ASLPARHFPHSDACTTRGRRGTLTTKGAKKREGPQRGHERTEGSEPLPLTATRKRVPGRHGDGERYSSQRPTRSPPFPDTGKGGRGDRGSSSLSHPLRAPSRSFASFVVSVLPYFGARL